MPAPIDRVSSRVRPGGQGDQTLTMRSASTKFAESLGARLAVISASLVLMALVGHDLQRRVEGAGMVADAAADRDAPEEATLQGEDIDGPAPVDAYFRQG